MPNSIKAYRMSTRLSVTAHDTAASATVIDYREFSGGLIITDGTTSITSFDFHVSDVEDGTFVPLQSSSGAIIQITNVVASEAYALPDALFAAPFFKLVPNTDDMVIVVLKS